MSRPLIYGHRYVTKLRETIRIEEFVMGDDGQERVRYSFLSGPRAGRSFEAMEHDLQKRIKRKIKGG